MDPFCELFCSACKLGMLSPSAGKPVPGDIDLLAGQDSAMLSLIYQQHSHTVNNINRILHTTWNEVDRLWPRFERVGLADLVKSRADTLSRGQQHLLQRARAPRNS